MRCAAGAGADLRGRFPAASGDAARTLGVSLRVRDRVSCIRSHLRLVGEG